MVLKIVAVTACVSGVAHTYMAAERLQSRPPRKVADQNRNPGRAGD